MKLNISIPSPLAIVAISCFMAGCHDDKGNYDYATLDKVEIVTENSGTGESDDDGDIFTIDRGDRLQISPDIYFNGQKVSDDSDAPLKYLWTFYTVQTGVGADYTIDTLATTRSLDTEINRIGGTYYAKLTVTNLNNGIEAYYRATCNVEETLTAGWMLLYERADRPGYSDVGLVINPLVKSNIQKDKEFWNLYSSSNGNEPLAGIPVSIFHEVAPLSSLGTPRIATDKTIAAVSPTDFTNVYEWDDLFYEPLTAGNIQFLGPSARMNSYMEALIMDNTLRVLNGGGATSSVGYFGVPKQSDTDLGELAPWACSRAIGGMETVVYSQSNGAFYYTTTSSIDFYRFSSQDVDACQFDVNDTNGAQLLFSDWNSGMTPAMCYDYFLFGNGNNRYIAEANFTTSGALTNIGLTWADMSGAPQITNATAFAVNSVGRYAYYGAGNKVYTAAYDSGRTTETWTAPDPNETVTCIRTNKYYYTMIHSAMMPNAGNVIHIATWNESTSQGKLYEYKINPASGTILSDEDSYEYSVPGKVKDMTWKFEMSR